MERIEDLVSKKEDLLHYFQLLMNVSIIFKHFHIACECHSYSYMPQIAIKPASRYTRGCYYDYVVGLLHEMLCTICEYIIVVYDDPPMPVDLFII